MYTPFYWNKWNLKELNDLLQILRKNNNNPNMRLKVRLKNTLLIQEINKIVKQSEGAMFNLIINDLPFDYKIIKKTIYVKPSSDVIWEIAQYNKYSYDNLNTFLKLMKDALLQKKLKEVRK